MFAIHVGVNPDLWLLEKWINTMYPIEEACHIGLRNLIDKYLEGCSVALELSGYWFWDLGALLEGRLLMLNALVTSLKFCKTCEGHGCMLWVFFARNIFQCFAPVAEMKI